MNTEDRFPWTTAIGLAGRNVWRGRVLGVQIRTFISIGLAIALLGSAAVAFVPTNRPTSTHTKQNVLVIMTDDETLSELQHMPMVQSLLVNQGTSFDNYYTTSPNCCPSRAAYYSGQVPHNDGISDNVPPLGGAQKFASHLGETIATWMQRSGYYTASIGKFLNGWGNPEKPDNWTAGIAAPAGWNHWFGLIDPTTYSYYNYDVSNDGVRRHYGGQPQDYQTDVLGQEVVDTISRGNRSGKPWFVSWTPLAPHVGQGESTDLNNNPIKSLPVPPPAHDGQFSGEPLYSSPSQVYGPAAADSSDVRDKPKYVRERVSKAPASRLYVTRAWQKELESIQGVDDWVGRIYKTLQDLGALDNTTIIFTSDNGLFHGEHGLIQKGQLYEEAVRVPLVVRGPGFPAGSTVSQLAEITDLAPTILNIGQARTTQPLDGADLKPLAQDPMVGANRALLLETSYSYQHLSTAAIRVGQWAYMAWSDGESELYDLTKDPYEVHNLAGDPVYAATATDLSARLRILQSCAGDSCKMYLQ